MGFEPAISAGSFNHCTRAPALDFRSASHMVGLHLTNICSASYVIISLNFYVECVPNKQDTLKIMFGQRLRRLPSIKPMMFQCVMFSGYNIVASELKDPICHSDECQIGYFSSEATIWSSKQCPLIIERPL